MNPTLTIDKDSFAAFCKEHGIRKVAVFGSALREDFGPESDIDLLVEFEPETRIGLIGLAGLELELGELMGRKVDLNTAGFLNRHIRERVLSSAETIYERA